MTCPRCITGLVITQYGETRCLICAWYLNEPIPSVAHKVEADSRQGRLGYRVTQYPRGHEYTPANTYHYEYHGRKSRRCKTCARLPQRER